jgi:hypothetical protein
VSSGRIIDHQITGKEKLAVARTKDRSLDSLTSPKDKRIIKEINKNADMLWQVAIAKRKADKEAAKEIAQDPRQLTIREQHKLKILNRKEKRLLKEALELEGQGKKRLAVSRRYQRNQTLKDIENLIKGTVYDTNV